MKKKIIIVIGVVLVIALGVLGYLYLNKEKNTNIDGKKFAEEYTSVTKDNVFVYRSAEEIINIRTWNRSSISRFSRVSMVYCLCTIFK